MARGDQKPPSAGPSNTNPADAYASNPSLLANGIEGTEAAGEYPYGVAQTAVSEYQ